MAGHVGAVVGRKEGREWCVQGRKMAVTLSPLPSSIQSLHVCRLRLLVRGIKLAAIFNYRLSLCFTASQNGDEEISNLFRLLGIGVLHPYIHPY